uniref:HIT-type domain-containing protein n=1 Tax=Phaeomonas parva TaxID=124430 RepID=A0A7S1U8Q5_9STRA|mmetsp:Transcript_37059/g.116000  ORF Transcript_37059/g.116000 Transcript_37059/m.116000 type:complete len:198 (+) Transcript_37059:165-758(+)
MSKRGSKGRKGWNETMKAMGAKAPGGNSRRSSSRIATVSRDLRVVDAETREHVRNARLDALEADNYMEEHVAQDDAYEEVDSEEEAAEPKAKRSRKSKAKAKTKITTAKAKDPGHKWKKRKYKPLRQVVYEQGYDATGAASVNHSSAAMGPSRFPPRAFCSVCGYFGTFKCPRCGMRYCRRRCQEAHKETRCMKFGT